MVKLAYVFPGQGSQSIGMLAQLGESYSLIIDTFHEVSEKLGYDLWQLTQEGPESRLNQTEYTQVSMLTADVAVFRLLQSLHVPHAKMMAGHSLGEYAALVCASAISLVDAAVLVTKRGQLMQETIPQGQGGMAAIVGLTDDEVNTLCQLASGTNEWVNPANFNALGQVVIAGHMPAVMHAIALAEEKGARLAKLIPVSVPCHCKLLIPTAVAFAEVLQEAPFKTPDLAVISNVDCSIYQSPSHIRQLLQEQLFKPVQWVKTIQYMSQQGINKLIECGPGKVLNGLVKRIDKSLPVISVNDLSSLEHLSTTSASSCC